MTDEERDEAEAIDELMAFNEEYMASILEAETQDERDRLTDEFIRRNLAVADAYDIPELRARMAAHRAIAGRTRH